MFDPSYDPNIAQCIASLMDILLSAFNLLAEHGKNETNMFF